MNKKKIRQMNSSLLRRLTTQPAVRFMADRQEEIAGWLEDEHYIQRFMPLFKGERLRCADVLALCRDELTRISPEPEEGWMAFAYDFA